MRQSAELLIARHGEAQCNVDQVVAGLRRCRGLTQRGRDQIRKLAERIADEHGARRYNVLYTSPLRRAHESSAIIGSAIDLSPVTEPDLREQDPGSADGKPWADVVTALGGPPHLQPERRLAVGGESWNDYLIRATSALDRIIHQHEGQRILIMGHGETIEASFRLLLGLNSRSPIRAGFAAHPASITRWSQLPLALTQPGKGWRWMLTAHNDISHLGRH